MSDDEGRELRRVALQAVVEVDQGLQIAEAELRAGQITAARETIRLARRLLPLLEGAIQAKARHAQREPEVSQGECCASGRCEVCTPGFVWGMS